MANDQTAVCPHLGQTDMHLGSIQPQHSLGFDNDDHFILIADDGEGMVK